MTERTRSTKGPTPNADTPYSLVEMDLRAEPLVICVPKIEKSRYYAVQLSDLYSFNVGYIGSRATGNDPGCYLIAGPDWEGDTPKGIKKVFPIATRLAIAIFRTQLFNPADMPNVIKIQAGYKVQPLSVFLKQPSPPAPPTIDFSKFTDDAFKMDFPRYLNFLLQFCPEVPEERELRAKFAAIGIAPGKPFESLSDVQKGELAVGLKEGYDAIEKQVANIGKDINGWQVGAAFGDRAFYHGDYLL